VPAWPSEAEVLPVLQADLALTTSAQYGTSMDQVMNHGIHQKKKKKKKPEKHDGGWGLWSSLIDTKQPMSNSHTIKARLRFDRQATRTICTLLYT